MLLIRSAQMTALEDIAQRSFEERQVRRLRARPDENDGTADEKALRHYVQRVVHNALGWGIDEEDEVEQLIDWCREQGPDFHLVEGREDLRELLEDPNIEGFAKIDVLREDLFETDGESHG